MISRRKFIRSSLIAGAGLASGVSVMPLAGCSSAYDCIRQKKSHKYVLADIHNHLVLNDWNMKTPLAVQSPTIEYATRKIFDRTDTSLKNSHEAGVDLICSTHFNLFDEWISMPTDPNPAAPFNTFRMLNLLEEEINGPSAFYAKIIKTPEEFKDHFNNRPDKNSPDFRIAVLHTLEGGHALGGSLKPLEKLSQRGVVIITIGHFYNKGIASAPNAFPFFPDGGSARPHQGLSGFGKEVIQEMEKLGIIVDVTHSTPTAMDDILKVSSKPLVATHMSVKTLGDHAISIHDEHVQEIVRRGGIISILFHPYWLSNYTNIKMAEEFGSVHEIIRTIRYVIKISGSYKNVGIGTDFGAYIPQLSDMNCLCQVELFRDLLLDEFGSEKVVEDILAKNVIDFIGNNWKRNI